MAYLVEFTSNERWVPLISFREEEDAFLRKPNRQHIPYEPGEVPSEALYQSGGKTISDFVPINGRMAVCPEVRALIERLEPGLHQFVPVHICRPRSKKPIFRLDGRVLEEPYYLFHVLTFLEALWVERSDVGITERGTVMLSRSDKKNLVLHKEIIRGHHIWYEGRFGVPPLVFSEELMAAVNEGRYKKLDSYHLREE